MLSLNSNPGLRALSYLHARDPSVFMGVGVEHVDQKVLYEENSEENSSSLSILQSSVSIFPRIFLTKNPHHNHILFLLRPMKRTTKTSKSICVSRTIFRSTICTRLMETHSSAKCHRTQTSCEISEMARA